MKLHNITKILALTFSLLGVAFVLIILSENYFQHADHFSRILAERENYKFLKDKDNNNQNNQVATKNVEATTKEDQTQEKEIL